MKLYRPLITEQDGLLAYQVKVEHQGRTTTLWYKIDKKFGELLSSKADASLVALLIPAMSAGVDIYVEGVVSRLLLHNLSGPYQYLLRQVIPTLRPIKIHVDEVQNESPVLPNGVASGFSGGIDSYCLVADHQRNSTLKLTHLMYNNVGSHGHGASAEKVFHERFRRLRPLADDLGLPFIQINSNLDQFYEGRFYFQQTHTPRNVSAALLLQNGIGTYLYASAYHFSDLFVGPSNDLAYTDAIALPLLSTESFTAYSSGSEYTRVEKTMRICNVPESYESLDVCVVPGDCRLFINCSACWKCLRTLATLEIGGKLDLYSKSFDLSVYKKHRNRYFSDLLVSKNPLLKEIVAYGREADFHFPIPSRILATPGIYGLSNIAYRAFNKIFLLSSSRLVNIIQN